jgi:hypothetical protein
LVVTVLDDTVLPLSVHRMPVPPAPGVAVRVAELQYVPPPLIVGFARDAFWLGEVMLTTTEAGLLAQVAAIDTAT